MEEKQKYFVQINFDDTGKFGNKFINEFNSDDERKKIIYINTKVPVEKFMRDEELSKMEKLILMMHIGDKNLLWKIAGDDEDLKKAADSIAECLDQDFLVKEIVNKIESDFIKDEENVRE